MKACRLEIVTFADGERSRVTAQGTLRITGSGFDCFYSFQGDEVRLTLDGRALEMRRRGENALHARFVQGEEGELRLGIAQREGGVPLRTQRLSAVRVSDGWRISLSYQLLFEQVRILHLKIAVVIISEEQ